MDYLLFIIFQNDYFQAALSIHPSFFKMTLEQKKDMTGAGGLPGHIHYIRAFISAWDQAMSSGHNATTE